MICKWIKNWNCKFVKKHKLWKGSTVFTWKETNLSETACIEENTFDGAKYTSILIHSYLIHVLHIQFPKLSLDIFLNPPYALYNIQFSAYKFLYSQSSIFITILISTSILHIYHCFNIYINPPYPPHWIHDNATPYTGIWKILLTVR